MCSNHELQATLNALGYLEDGVYYKSRDCLNCAKDLVRYLRRDDPNEKTVRRELLKTDVISNDLIPLLKVLKVDKKDTELFDITLRLLVNLTQSALNCFELKVPDNKLQYNIFIEIDSNLKKTKEPFTDEKFIQIICNRLHEIVSKSWEDRPEEEDMIVERILFLIRNVLQIKESEDDETNRLETDINSQDLLILSLHNAKLFETLTLMIESNNFIKYSSHILEIIVLSLHDQSPEELAKVSDKEMNLKSKRSVVEKVKDSDDLAKLLNKDRQLKKSNNKFRMNSRHSRFMGTYVATNIKSINDDNDLIVHKQARNMEDLLNDDGKTIVKKSKNKLALEKDETNHRSVLFIRIILKNFCLAFMQSSYNQFLRNLRDLIARKKLEYEEVSQYYWLIQFLTEFNRNVDTTDEQTKIEQIKETFSVELFHSVEVYIQHCIEMMRVEKKQARLWAKRMHTSLKCYKENLISMFVLEKKITKFNEENNLNSSEVNAVSPVKPVKPVGDEESDLVAIAEGLMDETEKNSMLLSDVDKIDQPVKSLLDDRTTRLLSRLKDQIFKTQEFRDLFITLLRDFDSNKSSKGFLRDLIEANHIFILLLEYHKKKSGTLSVMTKKKKKKTKKTTSKKSKEKGTKETKEEKEARLAEQKAYKKRLEQQKPDFKTFSWQTQFSKIASLLQNEDQLVCKDDNLMPFDFGMVTNDAEFDSQKDKVLEKIQTLLSEKKPDDAITLFREARALWPTDKELFGETGISADEEFEVFKNLYMKEIEINKPEPKEDKDNKSEEVPEETNDDEGIEDDLYQNEELEEFNNEGEDNENEPENYEVQEEDLDLEKFLFRYTHPHVLKCFILMLGEYTKNSDFLNRCCMSMFERIAYECHATPCLYQLSLFNLINVMYKDPLSRCTMDILDTSQKKSIDDIYASTYSTEDMFAFFRQLVKKFMEQAKSNDKLFLEVLFFKEKKVIYSLGEDNGGYEALKDLDKKQKKVAWTQEEQDELKRLYEKITSEPDENAEGDVIDRIMLEISDGNRKRKDICNQLVNIGCAQSIDEFKDGKGGKILGRNKIWRPEDISDLKQCFALVQEDAKQSNKSLREMMPQLQECLTVKRNKHLIADKLFQLQLVKERSEILASKGKKSDMVGVRDTYNEGGMNDFIDSDDDKRIDEVFNRDSVEKKKKKKKKLKKNKRSQEGKESLDLSDAESGSGIDESSAKSSSSASSSLSDSEAENSIKLTKKKLKTSTARNISKVLLSNESASGSDNETGQLRLEDTDGENSDDNRVQKLKEKKSDDDEDDDEKEDLFKKKSKKKKTKSTNNEEKENTKKVTVGRKTAKNVLAMIVSDNDEDTNNTPGDDANLISGLIVEAKKSPEKSTRRMSKNVLSDDSDSDELRKEKDLAKENLLKTDDFEEQIESPNKKAKKRKKKFKIVDDSSNSSSSTSEMPVSIEPIKVLSEIVNSDNSQNIKMSHSVSETATRVVEPVVRVNNNLNSDEDSDSDTDEDMPLSMKISMPKRQRLILSDDDDE